MNKSDKLRVSYRFRPETVRTLKKVQRKNDPVYSGRSITWLIEHAIEQYYKPMASDQNGDQS